MAITVLVLWLITAAAGFALLRAGGAERRDQAVSQAGELARTESAGAGRRCSSAPGSGPAGRVPAGRVPVSNAPAGSAPVLTGSAFARAQSTALPLTAAGRPPAGPHVRVQTPDGEHPLLEFSHPALAVTGIACWMMFTFVHYRPLAWIAFAILLTTVLAGLGWLLRSRQAVRRKIASTWSFPPRLVWLHGAVAASSLILTVLAALVASRA